MSKEYLNGQDPKPEKAKGFASNKNTVLLSVVIVLLLAIVVSFVIIFRFSKTENNAETQTQSTASVNEPSQGTQESTQVDNTTSVDVTTTGSTQLQETVACPSCGSKELDFQASEGCYVCKNCSGKWNFTALNQTEPNTAQTEKETQVTSETKKQENENKTISELDLPPGIVLDGNVPVSYKKTIVGTASSYTGSGQSATGKNLRPGYISVNPKQIPYGTKMWIVSNDGKYVYGYASAEDTGGFTNWTGSRATLCELYFPDEASRDAFGRRQVTIYIL